MTDFAQQFLDRNMFNFWVCDIVFTVWGKREIRVLWSVYPKYLRMPNYDLVISIPWQQSLKFQHIPHSFNEGMKILRGIMFHF